MKKLEYFRSIFKFQVAHRSLHEIVYDIQSYSYVFLPVYTLYKIRRHKSSWKDYMVLFRFQVLNSLLSLWSRTGRIQIELLMIAIPFVSLTITFVWIIQVIVKLTKCLMEEYSIHFDKSACDWLSGTEMLFNFLIYFEMTPCNSIVFRDESKESFSWR